MVWVLPGPIKLDGVQNIIIITGLENLRQEEADKPVSTVSLR